MNEEYYRVISDGIIIAELMTLDTALLLVKTLFEKFWEEPTLDYTIERMEGQNEHNHCA